MTDEQVKELRVLAEIRAAVGDPTGKLMQDELVARCRALQAVADAAEKLLRWVDRMDVPCCEVYDEFVEAVLKVKSGK